MNRRRASQTTAKNSDAQSSKLLHPITGRKLSPVEIERADRLHKKFQRAEKSLAAGRPLNKVFGHFSWYWRKRTYHSDRTRQVRFSYRTLVNRYYQWLKAGRRKESLFRRWVGLYPGVPAQALCNFVEFCSRHQFPHMKAAWQEFTRRKGWIGRGRQSTAPLKVTYGQLQYYLTGKKFAKLQSALRAITRAETHLDNLRSEYTAEIRARVPARPRRRTRQELSQGSAAL